MRSSRALSQTTSSTRPQSINATFQPLQARRTNSNNSSSSSNSGSPFVLKPRYANFKKVQASRPTFNAILPITITQPPNLSWKYGQPSLNTSIPTKPHIGIDPFAPGRPMLSNYRFLISSIPRPISFISTVSNSGIKNLSPFSYFQVVDHDPPIFVVGFSARADRMKDTRRNLEENGECVISVVSEHMVEGVNATSLDVPFEVSEWELSGFTGVESKTVRPERVAEAVVSFEGRLLEMKSLDYYGKAEEGKPTGALAIIEATRFWVMEDAVNDERSEVNLDTLRPLVQLGGMAYGRIRETFELPRPALASELRDEASELRAFVEPPSNKQKEHKGRE